MEMKVVFPGGKRVDAVFSGFTIKTDQPENSGGGGTAPSPFDLFLASVGTCVGYYVLSFCQERGIPTGQAELTMSTEKDTSTGMIGKIIIKIQLPPEFPGKYRQAVQKAAELCAVKKHLQQPPLFEISARIAAPASKTA
jgi:ribosomal protein S12 methylthiotransferase accessory factor